jgi:hypothetical protein
MDESSTQRIWRECQKMTEADDHANRLWELLGELGARPEGLYCSDTREGWWNDEGLWTENIVLDDHALAILCNAARRVLDANSVRIDWALESGGKIISYGVVDPKGNMIADCVDDYESALVAGMEWIVASKAES